MKKPVSLELSVLELSKILMYEFWYDYVESKYDKKNKIVLYGYSYIIVYIKTYYIYKDIGEVVETRFDTSNYELERPLPKA